MSIRKWLSEKLAEWVLGGMLTALFATIVTLLKHYKSEWADPVLYGSLVMFAGAMFCCGLILVSRTPRLRTKVSLDNIDRFVRDWLHNSRASVQNSPMPDAFFRFTVKLAGGNTVIVERPREGASERVVFRSVIVWKSGLPDAWKTAPESEQQRLVDLIKLEAARAKIGYSGLSVPIEDCFVLFRSIPITDQLNEDSFISVLWDIEAATNAIVTIYWIWARSLRSTQ